MSIANNKDELEKSYNYAMDKSLFIAFLYIIVTKEKPMDPVRVGNAIKSLRISLGYTQHQIAEYVSVTDQAVSKWERGLSVPDVSIVTKLSVLLNVDVDHLLEGNITYLESTWQGLLIIKEHDDVFPGTLIYDKPLVCILLSYFMLAGIKKVYISCPEKDKKYIKELLGDGHEYGMVLVFSDEEKMSVPYNTMVVYNNPFVYGPNLTKYFQRAISRKNGISVLTVYKSTGTGKEMVSYDNYKVINKVELGDSDQCCMPVIFFPEKYHKAIKNAENIEMLSPLYAEPMGNGMIGYSVTDKDSVLDTSFFVRYLEQRMGKNIYDIREIAKARGFI